MAGFDPDAYLSGVTPTQEDKKKPSKGGFDPDAYLRGPEPVPETSAATQFGRSAASLADTALNTITGTLDYAAYPVALAYYGGVKGMPLAEANRLAAAETHSPKDVVGRAFGVAGTPEYENAPLRSAGTAIGGALNENIIQPIAESTALPPEYVGNIVNTGLMGVAPAASRVAAPVVRGVADAATTVGKGAADFATGAYSGAFKTTAKPTVDTSKLKPWETASARMPVGDTFIPADVLEQMRSGVITPDEAVTQARPITELPQAALKRTQGMVPYAGQELRAAGEHFGAGYRDPYKLGAEIAADYLLGGTPTIARLGLKGYDAYKLTKAYNELGKAGFSPLTAEEFAQLKNAQPVRAANAPMQPIAPTGGNIPPAAAPSVVGPISPTPTNGGGAVVQPTIAPVAPVVAPTVAQPAVPTVGSFADTINRVAQAIPNDAQDIIHNTAKTTRASEIIAEQKAQGIVIDKKTAKAMAETEAATHLRETLNKNKQARAERQAAQSAEVNSRINNAIAANPEIAAYFDTPLQSGGINRGMTNREIALNDPDHIIKVLDQYNKDQAVKAAAPVETPIAAKIEQATQEGQAAKAGHLMTPDELRAAVKAQKVTNLEPTPMPEDTVAPMSESIIEPPSALQQDRAVKALVEQGVPMEKAIEMASKGWTPAKKTTDLSAKEIKAAEEQMAKGAESDMTAAEKEALLERMKNLRKVSGKGSNKGEIGMLTGDKPMSIVNSLDDLNKEVFMSGLGGGSDLIGGIFDHNGKRYEVVSMKDANGKFQHDYRFNDGGIDFEINENVLGSNNGALLGKTPKELQHGLKRVTIRGKKGDNTFTQSYIDGKLQFEEIWKGDHREYNWSEGKPIEDRRIPDFLNKILNLPN
jgi:hypothetical protein